MKKFFIGIICIIGTIGIIEFSYKMSYNSNQAITNSSFQKAEDNLQIIIGSFQQSISDSTDFKYEDTYAYFVADDGTPYQCIQTMDELSDQFNIDLNYGSYVWATCTISSEEVYPQNIIFKSISIISNPELFMSI